MSPTRTPEAPEAEVTDVTPQTPDSAVSDETERERQSAAEAIRDKLSPTWEPAPDETFAASDTSLRAVIARSKRNAALGNPEYDPLLNVRVWWQANGRGGHTPSVRPVADREAVLKGDSTADYWAPEHGTWVRNGVKKETDAAARMPDNLEEF